MKTRELIEALQKLIAEHPEAADNHVFVQWESDSGRTLERCLRTTRFRFTNGAIPQIGLGTHE